MWCIMQICIRSYWKACFTVKFLCNFPQTSHIFEVENQVETASEGGPECGIDRGIEDEDDDGACSKAEELKALAMAAVVLERQ